jgi:hypothetical protein
MAAHLTRPARNDRMVEMMRMTANGFQLTAYGLGWMRRQKRAGAASRKPMALPDALVYELYGLTEEEIRIVEQGGK